MFSVKDLLLILALGAGTLAIPHRSPNKHEGNGHKVRLPDYSRHVTCSTRYGSSRVKHIKTHTSTTTDTFTQTKRVYKHEDKTVTISPSTVTVKITITGTTTTVAGTETETATTTVTDVTTYSATNIVTATDSSAVTKYSTSTSTSTVPTPASFTPISKESGYVAKRDIPLLERGHKPKGRTSLQCGKGSSGPSFHPKQYPRSVQCIRTIVKIATRTVTINVPGHTKTIHPQAKTVTSTITNVKTITSYPCEVSETVTVTTGIKTTITVKSTVTTTIGSTTTIETVVPAATPYYQACAADNIITTANNGEAIAEAFSENIDVDFQLVSSSSSAYDCCVVCQTTSNCRASLFFNNRCFTMTADTCPAGQFNSEYFYTEAGLTPFGSVSNGPCGLVANGGTLGSV